MSAKILLFVAIVVLLLAFVPWLTFWAIGVLFGHHITVTFATWCAVWLLLALVGGSSSRGQR